MGDAHHKESDSSRIKSIIHPKATWEAFSQRRRPTDVPASTFYLVKLVEDDDYVAPVITKWLPQDLEILFFPSKLNSPASKDCLDDWHNYKHKFVMHPYIHQRTLFSFTLSKEPPPPFKTKSLSLPPIFFLGEGASVHRLVGLKKKKKGGYIKWLSFLLEEGLDWGGGTNVSCQL